MASEWAGHIVVLEKQLMPYQDTKMYFRFCYAVVSRSQLRKDTNFNFQLFCNVSEKLQFLRIELKRKVWHDFHAKICMPAGV